MVKLGLHVQIGLERGRCAHVVNSLGERFDRFAMRARMALALSFEFSLSFGAGEDMLCMVTTPY